MHCNCNRPANYKQQRAPGGHGSSRWALRLLLQTAAKCRHGRAKRHSEQQKCTDVCCILHLTDLNVFLRVIFRGKYPQERHVKRRFTSFDQLYQLQSFSEEKLTLIEPIVLHLHVFLLERSRMEISQHLQEFPCDDATGEEVKLVA